MGTKQALSKQVELRGFDEQRLTKAGNVSLRRYIRDVGHARFRKDVYLPFFCIKVNLLT